MKLPLRLLLALAPVACAAFETQVRLSVEPESVIVTEPLRAKVEISTRRRFQHSPNLSGDFIPPGMQLSMSCDRTELNGTNAWLYTIDVPLSTEKPGKFTIGPAVVSVPLRTGMFGFVTHSSEHRSGRARYSVEEPPAKDRPASYCGAISRDFSASASLDANVCTVGDPLLFTLELSGASDQAMVFAPENIDDAFRGTHFKLDAASQKTDSDENRKRFTWRVRAMKAGTVEFPSVEAAYFDAGARVYRTVRTAPIPVQVKAGVQAALQTVADDDGEDDFPMPDGIDLPFEIRNFTLRHAVSLACRASEEKEFLAAAKKYAEFTDAIESDSDGSMEEERKFLAIHYSNLGSLYAMAGRPRESLAAYGKSERISGATPSTERGMRAAIARLTNNPRADLPLPRLMFPFWFRLSLYGRIGASVCALAALFALFFAAVKAGRRLSAIAVAFALALPAQAFLFEDRSPFAGFFDDFPSMRISRNTAMPVRVSAKSSSAEVMAGERTWIEVEIDAGSVRIDPWSVRMQSGISGKSIAGKPVSGEGGNYKFPVVFLEPGTNTVSVQVSGSYSGSYCITNGNMISSGRVSNQPFRIEAHAAPVNVLPLPEEGRPEDFSGAIGNSFSLSVKLTPQKVRPGDLVTAQYVLSHDGYCPSNAVISVGQASAAMKTYELKETSRDAQKVVWRQMIVPQTAMAVKTPGASFSYFNIAKKRYERAEAPPGELVFASATAASTESSTIAVDAANPRSAAVGKAQKTIVLRFAPSAKSPVVAELPPDAELRETSRHNGWVRYESATASGWAM